MELPMESGDPTGPGRGAHQKVGPMSQARRYHCSRVTHTDERSLANMAGGGT